MELHEKINNIKAKVLNALEEKIDDAHIGRLREIAEILKINENTVKTRLCRKGRKKNEPHKNQCKQ